MKNIFFISDTHFGHANICKFLREDGVTKLRPWDYVEEHDEHLVQEWNKVVGPHDKVYHLGDVLINRKNRFMLDRLNGDKVLIKGNHDIFQIKDYLPYFRDVRSCLVRKEFIASHIPVHYDNLYRFKFNVHGHLHEHRVVDKWGKIDPRYLSVCVEHTEYRPKELSEITQELDKYR